MNWQPEVQGITKVVDALGGIKEFQYDNDQRLTAIETFKGRYGVSPFARHSMTRYFLASNHSCDKHNLLTKTFEDHTGRMQEAHSYWYDSSGNVISERLFGNLSGHSPISPTVDGSGHPPQNGCENYGTRYVYTQDSLHLPIEEESDNGKKIITQYFHQSTLVTSKLLLDHNRIIRREFFEYNDLNVVSKTIIDDGSTADKDDLTGVTQRKITYTFSKMTAPYGLVERKEEKYLDLATGQEKLLETTFYTYSKKGRLLQKDYYDAEHVHRYSLTWAYDPHGNITRETNALGHATVFRYDANDNLIFKQSEADTFYTEYQYDYSNRLISEKETHSDGNVFVVSHRYDYLHNRVATVDAYGNETRYIYDDLSRLIEVISPAVVDEEGHFASPIQKADYNVYNLKTYDKDVLGRVTHTEYNIRGKPVTIRYPDGTLESFVYNLEGTLQKATAANGTFTQYSYDILGRVTQEETYSSNNELLTTKTAKYNGFHQIQSTDAEGIVTEYRYDGAGRLICTQVGDQQEEIEYDALGRIKKVKKFFSEKFSAQVFEYDQLNRLLEERIEDHLGNILNKVSYVLDARGNRLKVINGTSITTMAYNGHNQLIETRDALGHSTYVHYNHHFRNEFGQNVLQVITTDPLGNQTLQTYDSLKRVVRVEHKNLMGQQTALQELFYDRAGNRTKTIDFVIINSVCQKQIVTTWEYNSVNQLIHLTEAVGTPEQKDTRYTYNEFGQKSILQKPDGVEIYYTYDPHGLLQTITSSDDTLHYHYLYNKNHLPIEVTDQLTAKTTTRTYDRNSLLINEELAHGHPIQYTYDRMGRVQTVALSEEISWQYSYDAAFLRQVDRFEQKNVLYSHVYKELRCLRTAH